ncbi:MAG: polyprenyl synthetase family protein [Desulfobacteraceae bacterium]|nr:MAG: polyprenyl synthetase family protein [Desulfobacteraceae bacterium]
MFDLAAYLARNNAAVESALARFLPPAQGNRLTAAMRYSLMAGGKRIRPNFCIAASEAAGGTAEAALAPACALEMIHTYSLIHDDLPGMDDDDLRRGQPTCHKAFDEATAILAGDALLTLAFEVLATMDVGSRAARLEVIRLIAAAAGFQGMVLGQMLDMRSEGRTLPIDELQFLHGRKTGDMIQAALISGALIAGGAETQIHQLTAYGRAVGLAFQVVDDILNVEGDPAVMGKASGTDTLRRKNSYPEILGLEKSKEFADNLKTQAIATLAEFDRRADPLRAIAAYVVERRR